MCIRHISHWQPCHHQRCTAIDICSYAEAHPGLNPSDCPNGENVFREGAEEGECKICGQREQERREGDRERRDGERKGHSAERHDSRRESVERRGHSKERYDGRGESVWRRGHSAERHDVRDESLDSTSTVDSDSTVRGEHGREKDRGDRHDGSKGDVQKKEDKKKDDGSGNWDSAIGLVLHGLAHAAS